MTAKECLRDFFAENNRILIVDDTVFNIESLQLILKMLIENIHIDSACHGLDAIKRIESQWNEHQQRYQLILMDVNMPICDG